MNLKQLEYFSVLAETEHTEGQLNFSILRNPA